MVKNKTIGFFTCLFRMIDHDVKQELARMSRTECE